MQARRKIRKRKALSSNRGGWSLPLTWIIVLVPIAVFLIYKYNGWKWLGILVTVYFGIALVSIIVRGKGKQGTADPEPIYTMEEAQQAIRGYKGRAEDFRLPISDLLQDAEGAQMAVLTDMILGRGWEPNGFIRKSTYSIYLYREAG